ncbi:hypothetical protein BDV93DRAFT_333555 [Ceratobasidium sp. AG-I]|nr:hypothetical protein BDV93DRAFT_333555 [Ceratobasidium sp. AG-I]
MTLRSATSYAVRFLCWVTVALGLLVRGIIITCGVAIAMVALSHRSIGERCAQFNRISFTKHCFLASHKSWAINLFLVGLALLELSLLSPSVLYLLTRFLLTTLDSNFLHLHLVLYPAPASRCSYRSRRAKQLWKYSTRRTHSPNCYFSSASHIDRQVVVDLTDEDPGAEEREELRR